jgi:hypothetical protein
MKNNSIRARLTALSQKIDSPSRDEYYDTPEARIDTIVGRDRVYYLRLRAVKQEWDKSDNPVRQEFQEYLRETYGIEMTIQPEGIDLQYRILDEKKHTLFLLKFGG